MKLKRIDSLAERLRVRTYRSTNGCLEWTGQTDDDGYGIISYQGRPRRVHRVVWEQVHGPLPQGLQVLHRCDNPPCCDLDHLFPGTHEDNMRDRSRKGRNPDGSSNLRLWESDNPEMALKNRRKGVASMLASRRRDRKCQGCSLVTTAGALGTHQKATGHEGWDQA